MNFKRGEIRYWPSITHSAPMYCAAVHSGQMLLVIKNLVALYAVIFHLHSVLEFNYANHTVVFLFCINQKSKNEIVFKSFGLTTHLPFPKTRFDTRK